MSTTERMCVVCNNSGWNYYDDEPCRCVWGGNQMNLMDHVQGILQQSLQVSRECDLGEPKMVRVNPKIMAEMSRIPHWFQHSLFQVQIQGAPMAGHFGRPSEFSPVASTMHVNGLYLPIREDPQAYFVYLDYGDVW